MAFKAKKDNESKKKAPSDLVTEMKSEQKQAKPEPEIKILDKKEDSAKSEVNKEKTKGSWTKIVLGVVIVLVAVIVIGLGVVGLGIYKFNWQDNSIIKKAVSIVPFPVAKVNRASIKYSLYQGDLETLNHFYNAQTPEELGLTEKPTQSFLQKSVISRIIREKAINDEAKKFNITITDKDIQDEYDAIVMQAGGAEQITTMLENLYGWTVDQFKEKVIRPYVERIKVQEYLSSDATINGEAKKKAEDILTRINSGEITFEDAAKQNSEDTTASAGGDLGYFAKGQMVKEFEDAAFVLEVGKISGIVQTQYGYHIIKVTEKIPASDTQEEQVRASHILIKTKDVDTYTNEQLAGGKVSVYLSGLEWKDDCGVVLSKTETCDKNDLFSNTSTSTNADTNTNGNTNTSN
ncbi:MAG: peptidylprolyl isomerase [Patescibacteria group bacterium]|jgi:parvulin-like peptidyl-prolyl isomerase